MTTSNNIENNVKDKKSGSFNSFRLFLLNIAKKEEKLSEAFLNKKWHSKCAIPTIIFSKMGDGFLYFSLILFILFFYDAKIAIYASILCLFSMFLFIFLKQLFKRKRPFEKINIKPTFYPIDNYSFPSGHATMSFTMASIMFPIMGGLGFFAYLIAALISISRFTSGVHYLSDILTGVVLGSVVGSGMYLLI